MNNSNVAPVIGLVVTGFDKGGLEQVVFNLYEGYRKNGWETYILCEKGSNVGYLAGKLHSPEHLCIFEGDRDTFLSFCYQRHITHLHYHYNTFFMRDARRFGIKTMYTIHNTYMWFNDDCFKQYGDILRCADAIVAVSEGVKAYFCSRSQIDGRDVDVILNGIDFEDMDNDRIPGALTRKGLGIRPDNIVACILATVLPAKHQIGLVGVMEEIRKKNDRIKLLIVGNCGDHAYDDRLKKEIGRSLARDCIQILPFFDHHYIGEFLRSTVDIFILPTLYEGCSNAVLEAVYCEKPMVLTDVGNARDMVGHAAVKVVHPAYGNQIQTTLADVERIAYQKDASNRDEIAEAVLEIAGNLDEWKRQAASFRGEKPSYHRDIMVKKYVNLIRQL